jgi:hypothetical protein
MGNGEKFVNGKMEMNSTNNFKHTFHIPSLHVMPHFPHLHFQHSSLVTCHLSLPHPVENLRLKNPAF